MIESPLLDEILAEVKAAAWKEGWKQGMIEGHQDSIVEILTARFGHIPPEVAARARSCTDEKILDQLLDDAITCPDLDTYCQRLQAPRK